MNKLRFIILLVFILPIVGYSITWEDPYFEEAVQQSGLICIGIVETSSPEKTMVRTTQIFKGKHKAGKVVTILRSPLVGLGYEEYKLTEGEEFFFMAKKHRKNYMALTDSYWNFAVSDSSITIPIRDPSAYISINREHFETFLSLLLKGDTSPERSQSFVEERLEELKSLNPLTKTLDDIERQMFILEVLYYFGKTNHATDAIRFLNSPYHHIRWSCVRALTTCGGIESQKAILNHIDSEDNSRVQIAFGKAVFHLNIVEAKSVLEAQIPKLSNEELYLVGDIMNPAFDMLAAPRYVYGAALMKIDGVQGAYNELLSKSKNYIVNNPNIKWDILDNKKTYYSIEEAMENPDSVFILTLMDDISELPEEIKELKNLKSLSIYDNEIKQLPEYLPEIGLIELNLSKNGLTSIPEVIFKCLTLKKIDLHSNELKEIDPRFFNLQHLEEMDLGGNSLSKIPNEINKLVNLKKLNLRVNDLESLPDAMSDLQKLEEIELYGNDFYEFPEALTKCNSMKTISIGSNRIKHLPKSVAGMENVKYIDLSYNPLSLQEQKSIANFPARIIINTQTYETPESRFYSIHEAIENKDIATIVHDVHNDYSSFQLDLSVLKSTRSLGLTNNRLTAFPTGLTKLNDLKTLVLHHNNISVIPDDINAMTNLSYLNLGYNNLVKLPSTIKELPLTYLNLESNNFSEPEKELIESWFDGKCKIIW